MLIKILKNIKDKFEKEKNLHSMDFNLREEYYKEIETLLDSLNFYKTHKGEFEFSKEEERKILDFFWFLFNLGDFLTPLNIKEILFIFKEKRNQLDFSFLLLECTYLFEDYKGYENILDFLEKNIQFLQEEEKRYINLEKALFYLMIGENKNFEKIFEKEISLQNSIDEKEIKKIKYQALLSILDLKDNLKKFLKINNDLANLNIEKIIKKYEKSMGSGDFYEEKFYRNLLEKYLKEKPLDVEKLNRLTEFLSLIDTYFLSDHNKEVRDMSLKICEIGKNIWSKNIDMEKIEKGAYFHDLGKISIPWVLMDRKISLNQKEREKFERHSYLSYEIIKSAKLEEEAIFALDHHKFINGKGYPKDKKTPSFEGNIICLAESFIGAINLSSKEKVRTKEELLIEFKQLRGIYFYPEVVDALLLITFYN